jgi:hypothetical protein
MPTGPPILKLRSAGFCHDCHNTARWEITFGPRRGPLKLCDRCAGYLVGFLGDRLTEHKRSQK